MLGSLYLSVIFLGILNSIFVQPVMSAERSVMYRERGAGMWGPFPCALSCCPKVVCILAVGLYASVHSDAMIMPGCLAVQVCCHSLVPGPGKLVLVSPATHCGLHCHPPIRLFFHLGVLQACVELIYLGLQGGLYTCVVCECQDPSASPSIQRPTLTGSHLMLQISCVASSGTRANFSG